MNQELKFLVGILSLTIALILGVREIKNWSSIDNDDGILQSFSIRKFTGIFILMMVGVYLLYCYFD